jgi:transposase
VAYATKGVWEKALTLLRKAARTKAGRDLEPSMVMLDCQTVKGGRGGPGFHEAGGKYGGTFGASELCLLTTSASPSPPGSARCSPTSGSSRWSRAFSAATRSRSPPQGGASRTSPRASSPSDRCGRWKVEDCFAQLGRWRRLSRSYEATTESATTWLHVACVGYLLTKL